MNPDKKMKKPAAKARVRLSLIALAAAMSSTLAQAEPVAWLGGSGSWFDDLRWSGGYLPSNGSQVSIEGTGAAPAMVTVEADDYLGADAASLLIGAHAGLSSRAGVFVMGNVVNAGRLELVGGMPRSAELTAVGSIRLATGGTTSLSGQAELRSVYKNTGITVESGHVLSGHGAVTARNIVNQGLIEASGGTLSMDAPSSAGMLVLDNQGTLRAAKGATLLLSADVLNSQGSIQLNDATLIAVGAVRGGTIVAQGTGSVLTGTLQDVTLHGRLRSNGLTIAHGITNNAVIDLASSGEYGASLGDWYGSPAMIDGQGEINAIGPIASGLYNVVLGAGQVFRGSAVVHGSLVNHGRIVVQGAEGMSADDDAQMLVNRGVLEVAAGSRLKLAAGLDNKDHTVSFAAGSMLEGRGTVTGGRLHAGSDMALAGSFTFADLALKGNWHVAPDARLRVQGRIQVDDLLTISQEGGRQGSVVLVGDTVLAGAGQTVLGGMSAAIENDWPGYGNQQLTIEVGHTLRGSGNLSARLVNDGLLQVDAGGTMQLSGGYPMINRGVMRTLPGGTLRLAGGELDNAGGQIELGDGGRLFDHNGRIRGGILRGGSQSDAVILARELNDVTLTGRFKASSDTLWYGGSVGIGGTLTNEGVLTVGGDAGGLVVRGEARLAGGGRTVLQGGDGLVAIQAEQGTSGTLTIGAGQTVEGRGRTAFVSLINQGTLDVQGGELRMYYAPQLVNEGTLRIARGSDLVTDTDLVQQGAGSRLLIDGGLTAGTVIVKAGTLQGSGVLKGDLLVDGGALDVSAATGALTVRGDYGMGEGGTLSIDLASMTHGLAALAVEGDVALGGLLTLDLGAWAQLGDSFTILTYGGLLSGDFSQVVVRGTDLQVAVSYIDNRVEVSMVPEPSSAWLSLAGLAGLAVVQARRKRATPQG